MRGLHPLVCVSCIATAGAFTRSNIQAMDERHCFRVALRASPPQDEEIGVGTLISQAYSILTVDQLRDLLRKNGAKVSGNKRELVDRLEGQMMQLQHESPNIVRPNKISRRLSNADQHFLFQKYMQMTLNELKDMLRERSLKVSGRKKELVHRLMTGELAAFSDSRAESNLEWVMLASQTMTFASDDDTDAIARTDIEMPFLSGIMFVNKPPGWATLPTKQQLDDPNNATYPCLSDSVKKWLGVSKDGQEMMKRALDDEQRFFSFYSSQLDGKQRKKWDRKAEKMQEKLETFEPRPCHRLDIDTSGIVCVALTPYALRSCNMLFERKSLGGADDSPSSVGVQKRYVAIVDGELDEEQGLVEYPIGKVSVDTHNEWACEVSGSEGAAFIRPGEPAREFVPESLRDASTSYQVRDKLDGRRTKVELMPHTGRGHQLRLHMAALGHPISNDAMHCERNKEPDKDLNNGKLCLHAERLLMDCWVPSDGVFQLSRVAVDSPPTF